MAENWYAMIAMILQSLNGLRYGVPKAFVFVELPTPITTSILVSILGLGFLDDWTDKIFNWLHL